MEILDRGAQQEISVSTKL